MVVLYTNHCPLCNRLKEVLDEANVEYVEETNIEKMINLGISRTPMLRISEDSELLTYKDALNWLNEKR